METKLLQRIIGISNDERISEISYEIYGKTNELLKELSEKNITLNKEDKVIVEITVKLKDGSYESDCVYLKVKDKYFEFTNGIIDISYLFESESNLDYLYNKM